MDIKVEAIIVTYNRPEILAKCINSLLIQDLDLLKQITIIVNSKDEETKQLINDFKAKIGIISEEFHDNVGPAGGFYYGLKRFQAHDNNYAWLMDDDIILEDNCLSNMISYVKSNKFIYPSIFKPDGTEVISFGWWGALISRELILQVGLPNKELFYWAEDTDYLQYRIRIKTNNKPLRVKDAKAIHLHKRSKNKPGWYYYYVVRNSIYYRKYIRGNISERKIRTYILLVSQLIKILFYEKSRMRKIKLALLGYKHGNSGLIGKTVDPNRYK